MMKRIFSDDIVFVVLYIALSAVLCHKGALTVKTIVTVCGVTTLIAGGAVFFFSTNTPSRRLGAVTGAVGATVVLFCPFFINLSLVVCGGAIAMWGILRFLQRGSIVALGDTVIGVMLALSVFVLKKFLLPVCAVLMIVCAVARLLTILGVCDF
ncbi:MAG: hypothetical protein IJD07_02185 [Clostridia bacterium]|nr:hypothetical protein [Clostridia bacterium]